MNFIRRKPRCALLTLLVFGVAGCGNNSVTTDGHRSGTVEGGTVKIQEGSHMAKDGSTQKGPKSQP